MADVYIVGDIHGHLDQLVRLLHGAGLLDPDQLWTTGPAWTGGTASLWFMGDFTDRGPAGVAVIDLVMRLQREAADAGGSVQSLLGNHELMLVAAACFGNYLSETGNTFLADWLRYGGQPADLEQLTPQHIAWIGALPAMARVGDRLLLHADSLLYRRYGSSVDRVNAAFAAMLAGEDLVAYDAVLEAFADRGAFAGETGVATARAVLRVYGGRQLIHGHTPVSTQTGQAPTTITAPLVYAGGLCVNVDPGLYRGGPGFVYRLPPLDGA
jgi:hypothetical protein